MIKKDIDSLEPDDIRSLIFDKVQESRTIEYKEQLPGKSDKDRKEFLADVSSFANAGGGDILYGVVEKRGDENLPTGILESVPGLSGVETGDPEILRLENIIRTGIEPRVPKLQFRAIGGFPEGPVIVLRIWRSWMLPHMVTLMGHDRFYSRSSNGKCSLDVSELRSAFLLNESMAEKIRRFRDERLTRIIANEGPLPLREGPKMLLHLHPIQFGYPEIQRWVGKHDNEIRDLLSPINSGGYNQRYNIDGLLTYDGPSESRPVRGYTQLFRTGAIEAVVSDLGTITKMSGFKVEEDLLYYVGSYLKAQEKLGVETPIVVMLSLLGLKGCAIIGRPIFDDDDRHYIDRDLVIVPDVLMEEYHGEELKILMRPVFDALWQASGWDSSMSYDSQGQYIDQPPRSP